MTRPACPLSFEALVDYLAGDLEAGEAARLEDHLFACDACAARAERLGDLVAALREAPMPVIPHARLEAWRAAGLRVQETPIGDGEAVTVAFARGLDLLVHRLRGDLAGARRVDCAIGPVDGAPFAQLEHVPFDAVRGEILVACHRHYMEEFPPDTRFQVTVTDAAGGRRERTYIVHHLVPNLLPGA
jgi:hypothetical protein